MPSSDISRSTLVQGMVRVGSLLAGPKPLEERMTGLCAAAASVLQCSHFTVLTIDGQCYRGAFQHGLPPRLANRFDQYEVPRDKPIVQTIEACDTYLLWNNDSTDASLTNIAALVGVAAVIIVPFTHPDGAPLGYVTAGYASDKREVTRNEAELAMGAAGLAQTTLLRHLETQRRRDVARAMLQVADSERRRLSRDIHDDPLQRMLALRIGLEGFRARMTDEDLIPELDSFVEQCRRASASLRDVMLRTHPNASELADLEDVLEAMIERDDSTSPNLELIFRDDRSAESPSYLVPAIHRVAQQAAGNTIRHANADVLRISLRDHDGGTLLTIDDDGDGFDPNVVDRTRLGLVSMREHTELLGGTLILESAPSDGTYIAAWFPHTDTD